MKLVISSNFWPFVLISALILFMLLVMILLFSVLTSIPYAVALSYESVGEVLKVITAAALKIDVVGKPSVVMDAFCVMFFRNKLNRMGESKHP